jgi:flagellar basal body rod protein FlgG
MATILGASASGMVHNQGVLDTVANNLANMEAFSFKKVRPLAEGRADPTQTADSTRLGVADTTRDLVFSGAAAQMDEDPLHFAVQDDTFFRVKDVDGTTVFTRFGALSQDASRNITAFGGRLLDPPVTVPDGLTNPTIDQTGRITATDPVTTLRQDIGQITLARFTNPQALVSLGNGLYQESANSGAITDGLPGDPGYSIVIPGALEGSNVDMAEEFTNMIIAQRAYQACAKTFSVGDDMLRIATNITQ